MLYSCL